MYSIIKKIVLVIFAGAVMTSANGQTLNNILTKISNASGKSGETVSSMLDNLIGTKKLVLPVLLVNGFTLNLQWLLKAKMHYPK